MHISWYNSCMNELQSILSALRKIRAPQCTSEYNLHALILNALTSANLTVSHEALLQPRRRIDFLCGTVGVEVKRGKPQRTMLLKQLTAYASCNAIEALILVAEHPPRLPDILCGKPLVVLSLQRLWGVAV